MCNNSCCGPTTTKSKAKNDYSCKSMTTATDYIQLQSSTITTTLLHTGAWLSFENLLSRDVTISLPDRWLLPIHNILQVDRVREHSWTSIAGAMIDHACRANGFRDDVIRERYSQWLVTRSSANQGRRDIKVGSNRAIYLHHWCTGVFISNGSPD